MNDELNERRRSSAADGSAPPVRPSPSSGESGEHLDAAVLSGYLDDPAALPAPERSAIEAHLAACGECRATLAELRALVTAMAALPEVEPSRSFALTPEMVGQREHLRVVREAPRAREPVALREPPAWYERQMRALRWATVAAAVLFVVILTADITSNRFFRATADDDVAPISAVGTDGAESSAPTSMEAPPSEPDAASEDAATTSDTMRAAEGEQPVSATPAAAVAQEPSADDAGEEAETFAVETEEALLYQDELDAAEDLSQVAQDEDLRSMSTSEHYWRLAQVGLALIIVLLIAALIVMPRRYGVRRQ